MKAWDEEYERNFAFCLAKERLGTTWGYVPIDSIPTEQEFKDNDYGRLVTGPKKEEVEAKAKEFLDGAWRRHQADVRREKGLATLRKLMDDIVDKDDVELVREYLVDTTDAYFVRELFGENNKE